jgi:hypothetical protein
VKKPSAAVVAALVEARQGTGRLTGKPGWEAFRLGLVEEVARGFELNLRGQDVADDAIALAAQVRKRA